MKFTSRIKDGDFVENYRKWLTGHLESRTGERLNRLIVSDADQVNHWHHEERLFQWNLVGGKLVTVGIGHAEFEFLKKVWWPLFRTFEFLHPEYEISYTGNGLRFLDFAVVYPYFLIAIEIDGYGPHLRDIDRRTFSDERRRHTFLVANGWQVCRFSYDDVKTESRIPQELLELVMNRNLGLERNPFIQMSHSNLYRQRRIIQLAFRKNGVITANIVSNHLNVSVVTARRLISEMKANGILIPVNPKSKRIHAYKLSDNIQYDLLITY